MSLNDEFAQINALAPAVTVSQGHLFYMNYYNLSLGNGESVDIHYRIPTEVKVNGVQFVLQHSSNGPIRIQLFEDSDVTAGTTALQGFNYNRNKGSPPQLQAWTDSTVNALGTEIDDGYVLGTDSIGGRAIASAISVSYGIRELKTGSDYIQRITNQGTGGTNLVFLFTWVEN